MPPHGEEKLSGLYLKRAGFANQNPGADSRAERWTRLQSNTMLRCALELAHRHGTQLVLP
jgi:hypothetical protein